MSGNGATREQRLGLVSLVAATDGILLVALGAGAARLGFVRPIVGLGLAALGILPAVAAVALGLAARRGSESGSGRWARIGLAIGLLHMLGVAFLGLRALGLPRINDITTDLVNPPRLSGPGGEYPYPAAFAGAQWKAYPDVRPLVLEASADVVLTVAREVAVDAGWRNLEATGDGRGFRAIAVTPVFRFVDDVAVRVTPEAAGSRIDVRSRSRVGRGDLGTNAARIRNFLDDLRRRAAG